jgi:hypothetical protein
MSVVPLYDPSFTVPEIAYLTEGDKPTHTPSKSLQELTHGSKKFKVVGEIVNRGLNHCLHSFKLVKLEQVGSPAANAKEFKRRLRQWRVVNPRFFFHGTKESNHSSIFDKGFLIDEEYLGDTDKGYIGKGVYVSPTPEYSAAYIKETSGITRFNYTNPVSMGTTFKIIGCLATVGRFKTLPERCVGSDITEGYDAHTAWVTTAGNPTGDPSEIFAKEYVIRETRSLYPRFVVTLTKVDKETIWFDANLNNAENTSIRIALTTKPGYYLYATGDASLALNTLKRRKYGTSYRAVTSGRGGEELVKNLRSAGLTCPVMVFCMNVKLHQAWARKYSSVRVTATTSEMMNFASWAN